MTNAGGPDGMFERGRRSRPSRQEVSPELFREQFNETLAQVLNLDSWRAGRDPADEYRRIEEEVNKAVEAETDHEKVHSPRGPPPAGTGGAVEGEGTRGD